MNKTQLIYILASQNNLEFCQVKHLLESLQFALEDALNKGEVVSLSGFGKFWIKSTAPAQRINPTTKRIYQCKSKKVAVFRPFKKFKYCVK